jgi:2-polyprenyl-6-methoxyphenol hydroxylase-like FAD-dependent oxidoreductase
LTAATSGRASSRCLSPTGHRWDRVPGATLLGDAVHLTAPNGEGVNLTAPNGEGVNLTAPNGEGVNLAMLDGVELGEALAAHPDAIETALTQYEQVMFSRSAEAVTEWMAGIDSAHNTAQGLIDWFTEKGQ